MKKEQDQFIHTLRDAEGALMPFLAGAAAPLPAPAPLVLWLLSPPAPAPICTATLNAVTHLTTQSPTYYGS